MIAFRFAQVFAIVLLMGSSILSGCGRGILNSEPFTDMTVHEDGTTIAADTERNWQEFRWDIDPQIEAEMTGEPAPGFPTWNEKWTRALAWIERTQENSPKYISYIIEARRRMGLPELDGYPRAASD